MLDEKVCLWECCSMYNLDSPYLRVWSYKALQNKCSSIVIWRGTRVQVSEIALPRLVSLSTEGMFSSSYFCFWLILFSSQCLDSLYLVVANYVAHLHSPCLGLDKDLFVLPNFHQVTANDAVKHDVFLEILSSLLYHFFWRWRRLTCFTKSVTEGERSQLHTAAGTCQW